MTTALYIVARSRPQALWLANHLGLIPTSWHYLSHEDMLAGVGKCVIIQDNKTAMEHPRYREISIRLHEMKKTEKIQVQIFNVDPRGL